ncbi:Sterol-sensing domain and Acriflavin resistance protein family and Patched family-containing protein [Aphelenchoides fujianensis]|nr:Sterol-sensing domain and Acriflavin resistance protein family and Patched family-containing protein [Aphelenchoides fujianensis]
MLPPLKSQEADESAGDTLFVRVLKAGFRRLGSQIARRPFVWFGVSTLITLLCAARIPFTPLSNDVSDFTPSAARARQELQTYKEFFANTGDPVTVYVFVTAKNNGNMLGVRQLEEAVRLLNFISAQIPLHDPISGHNATFNEFCNHFCTINEPIRHFYVSSPLRSSNRSFGCCRTACWFDSNFGNSTEHVDLGYPITTVLGRQLHMDPNFFGVKASPASQVKNNIREIKLVGLQFRAELPAHLQKGAVQTWEMDIVRYVRNQFKSEHVDALVVSETFLTGEVVRAGLTLIPFLAIGFVIMSVFSIITMSISAFYMRQLGAEKVVLAVMAAVCPFMATGTALGLMFWLGCRFGSILCVTGISGSCNRNAYLMVNSWQQIRKRQEKAGKFHEQESTADRLESLLVGVMMDTGALRSRSTPEIQLFSIGNALAITLDYVFQWTIFGAVMVIAGRWELRAEKQAGESEKSTRIVLELRNTYIIPFYAVAIVFVNKPGNFSDARNLERLSQLVGDFERLPSSLGKFSTKFFLRDYLEFVRSSDESTKVALDELLELEGEETGGRGRTELQQFLNWPEFEFWKGFLNVERDPANGDDWKLNKFFFTTASFGSDLTDWSKRAELLQQWRAVADSYPDFEVSVFEDDAKFLDLIPTMIPQTAQSAFCTLFCMFLVCLLFIRQPTAVIIANFSIFSTCVGVFGILSLMGVELDPITYSASIMSIGFSVDIPAHLVFHFYKTGTDGKAPMSTEDRIKHCLGAIGFPILEAGLSTIICVSSLGFVDLHMAQVFARTMVLVVSLGLLHGLLIIPVLFYLVSLLPSWESTPAGPPAAESKPVRPADPAGGLT